MVTDTPPTTPVIKTTNLHLYAPFHRAFSPEDHIKWLNNQETVAFSEQRHRIHSLSSQTAYLNSFDHVHSHIWEISYLIGGYDQPIGTITAYRDRNNGTADVGILIGERRGCGFGSEAWKAVCDWLLKDGVRKVEAACMESNTAMVRTFLNTGMAIEGRRPGHFMRNGRPVDMVYAGRLK